jgi:hypothetical protein
MNILRNIQIRKGRFAQVPRTERILKVEIRWRNLATTGKTREAAARSGRMQEIINNYLAPLCRICLSLGTTRALLPQTTLRRKRHQLDVRAANHEQN